MKHFLFLIALLFVSLINSLTGFCQTLEPALLKDANSVILNNHTTITTKNNFGFKREVEFEALILNEKAADLATILIPYDQYSKVSYKEGRIETLDGDAIEKIKSSDLIDLSAVSGFSIYEDNRLLYYKYHPVKYPFVVKYHYEITYKHNFFVQFFSPLSSYGQSIHSASLKLITGLDQEYLHKEFGISPPEITQDKNQLEFLWQFDQMPAIQPEPFAYDIKTMQRGVMLAPREFAFEKYEGSNASWTDFGDWILSLQHDRLELPEEAKAAIHKLTDTISNQVDKARAIYEYMQGRSRYVSIQLGIGGFQPFSASVVHELGYGDCKALTNYTEALMQEAGIEAYYTLVKAGKHAYSFEEDFTANQFNHTILCTVLEGDTVWLECTSQKLPFGFLGDFTDNRPALLIKQNESKLVQTTSYNVSNNQSISNSTVTIKDNGNAIIRLNRSHRGMHYDENSYFLSLEPHELQKKVATGLGWKNYTLENITVNENRRQIPDLSIDFEADVLGMATKMGNRLFIPLSPYSFYDPAVPKIRSRNSKFVYYQNAQYTDTILVYPPKDYSIESQINEASIESEFGSYRRSISEIEGGLKIVRTYTTFAGKWEADDYARFYEYRDKVLRFDQQKLAFKLAEQ
ncbi:MAG: DUF3857 domain-containing transglutaminase family protein [Bacteroidetes bacterium]|nr:DUF3857 domain-containing transglutaminase family protein [Bacteroidota bacterium]